MAASSCVQEIRCPPRGAGARETVKCTEKRLPDVRRNAVRIGYPQVGEIEGNRYAGKPVRREPLTREPNVRPEPDLALDEIVVEAGDTLLDDRSLDREPEIAEALL